jgi:hypothetical protein
VVAVVVLDMILQELTPSSVAMVVVVLLLSASQHQATAAQQLVAQQLQQVALTLSWHLLQVVATQLKEDICHITQKY